MPVGEGQAGFPNSVLLCGMATGSAGSWSHDIRSKAFVERAKEKPLDPSAQPWSVQACLRLVPRQLAAAHQIVKLQALWAFPPFRSVAGEVAQPGSAGL